MKHIITSALVLTLSLGCQSVKEKTSSDDLKKEDSTVLETSKNTELEISIDEKVEVMYYVFALTDYPLVSRHASTYKAAVLDYFKPYQQHKAVKIAKELFELGFGADFPISWIYQYDQLPELQKTAEVDFPFELIAADSLDLFRDALKEFYMDSDCKGFIASQQSFLDEMIQSTKDSITSNNIIEIIEDYFGVRKEASYTLVLSPLLHQGGFSVERMGKAQLYAVVGPNKIKDSIPQFDRVFLEQDMIIHEFGHNYTNPIIDQHYDQMIELGEVMFPLVKEAAAEEGYASWEAYLYELLDRSTTIRITESTYGHEAAEELLNYEKSVGFEHCELLLGALKEYEKQRDKYKKLGDFFPEIIRVLESEFLTKK